MTILGHHTRKKRELQWLTVLALLPKLFKNAISFCKKM
jgi:hypothetical protein